MNKRKIILDVDTGTDDAVALVMGMLCDEFDLLGITTVNGNIEVKLTTDNSLRVVECCDKQGQVEVYQGAEYPMVSTLLPWSPQSREPLPRREGSRGDKPKIHEDHLPLPAPAIKKAETSAVVWLIDTLLKSDGDITLVPVGPMTNIALAMRSDPRIIPKIKEIVLMGGGYLVNNATPFAEFNIFADPEAMEILLQSGVKLTIVPLDATHKAYITKEEGERIKAIGTKPAKLVSDVLLERIEGYSQQNLKMRRLNAAPLHDALALCYVIHPQVLKNVKPAVCHVDISNGFTSGSTNFDMREFADQEADNCYLALDADKDMFYQWLIDTLEKDKIVKSK